MIGATSRFVQLEKIGPIFSSWSFTIRLNLLHPQPSLFLYMFGLLLPLWFFSTLVNCYVEASSISSFFFRLPAIILLPVSAVLTQYLPVLQLITRSVELADCFIRSGVFLRCISFLIWLKSTAKCLHSVKQTWKRAYVKNKIANYVFFKRPNTFSTIRYTDLPWKSHR